MINVTGLDDAAAVIADAMEQQQHLGVQAMATKVPRVIICLGLMLFRGVANDSNRAAR